MQWQEWLLVCILESATVYGFIKPTVYGFIKPVTGKCYSWYSLVKSNSILIV